MTVAHLYGARRIGELEDAIGHLEGRAFGKWLQFSALGYDDQLSIDLGSRIAVPGFKELPGLRGFADELNEVMTPVIERYRIRLRQELSNQAVTLAAKAIAAKAIAA